MENLVFDKQMSTLWVCTKLHEIPSIFQIKSQNGIQLVFIISHRKLITKLSSKNNENNKMHNRNQLQQRWDSLLAIFSLHDIIICPSWSPTNSRSLCNHHSWNILCFILLCTWAGLCFIVLCWAGSGLDLLGPLGFFKFY